ncbi:MAG: DUF2490 domain-containing protein [Mariniphaga sp.]
MRRRLSLLLLILTSSNLLGQERSFQLWNLNVIQAKVTDRFTLGVTEKVQYTTESGAFNLKYGDLSVTYAVNSWFSIGVGGRLLHSRKGEEWKREQRPMVFGDMDGSWRKVTYNFSNRIEYRFIESGTNHFRHWQMFRVEMPPFRAPWFSLYVAEESFIPIDPLSLQTARFYAGTKVKYTKNLAMRVYYVLEKRKSTPSWSTGDVLGLNLIVLI